MQWFGRRNSKTEQGSWRLALTLGGVDIVPANGEEAMPSGVVEPAVTQWIDEGFAIERGPGWHIPWDAVYELRRDRDYRTLAEQVGLPAEFLLTPRLSSRGALTDRDFVVSIAGWVDDGGQLVNAVTLTGAAASVEGRSVLLPSSSWEILKRVSAFAQRSDDARDELSQRLAWGDIRRLALAAGARLDDFLFRTVVLAPDKLKIGLRRYESGGSQVIEVIPDFAGCPAGWLSAFDASAVRDRYDLVTSDGIIQVIVRPEVKQVLEQIRRMPGRRVSGPRAEAFITNPFAALGESASAVIDPDEFESARAEAGIDFDRFAAAITRDLAGTPVDIGITVETKANSETRTFSRIFDDDEAREFVNGLRDSLAAGNQLYAWTDCEFELLGDAEAHLKQLEQALADRLSTRPAFPTAQFIYDLSAYSDRIIGIGEEKPYSSPYIAKKQEGEGWFPNNLVALVELPPTRAGDDPRYVSLDDAALASLQKQIEVARETSQTAIQLPGVLDSVSLQEAERIVSTFARANVDATLGKLDEVVRDKAKRKLRNGLLIKPNIAVVDYLLARRAILKAIPAQPTLPAALRPSIQLKEHQLSGLAWLQHLFELSPDDCRGAVLADDMGLGKTLQLLALISWAHEQDATLPPALIVAPVALLENWREELSKFFAPSSLPVLEVYGDTLAALRVPRHEIEQQLRDNGLVRFLKSRWVGSAKVVLTTYETLRDLEFSFAAEKWSILVCDEAQKIKNPNALITRAAKKQNARFRVACTGTPVENTLADLWCLFDLVQPGLLGALNDFGQRYRRPIEAKSEDEKGRVEELRRHIEPQILRRLKKDVAKDLPKKIEVGACKQLPMTRTQRALYSHAVAQYSKRTEAGPGVPFKNVLGLLQYLRLICTDPRPHGLSPSLSDSAKIYRSKAAKFDWLLTVMKDIKNKGEKALIFCEFKDIQRLLRHYILEDVGYTADIINGETSASSKSEQSRQKRIRSFQEQPGFGVIILSPLAVGYGVNIQAANHVIHYTRTWNPAKEDQATDRAYRIGQEKDVYVYCPVVVAEDFSTFDVKLDQLIARKRALAEDMLNGAGDVAPGEFDIKDVAPPDSSGLDPRRLVFDDVLSLLPRHFEAYVAVLWSKQGFRDVTLTPSTGDGGVDVVALNADTGDLIQCKTSQSGTRELGWEAIKDVVTGEAAYKAKYPGVTFQKPASRPRCLTAGHTNMPSTTMCGSSIGRHSKKCTSGNL